MKPYIVAATETTATVAADTKEEAVKFARNYFGDYRHDYRNHNKVELTGSEPFGLDTFYCFSIVRCN